MSRFWTLATFVVLAAPTAETQSCGTAVGGYCGNAQGALCCPRASYCQPWNNEYYQCLSEPIGCGELETDVDYYGNDIASVVNISPSDCCTKCQTTVGCNYFTFVNLAEGGPTCYLKSTKGASTRKVGAVSGRRILTAACSTPVGGYCGNGNGVTTCCPTSTYCQPWDKYYYQCLRVPDSCGEYETDVDYYGADVGSVSNTQPWECCTKCQATVGCTYFTYVSADPAGPTCYMKSSSAGRVRKVGAVSGRVVKAPAPSPIPTPTSPATTPVPTLPITTAPPNGSQCVKHLKNIFYHGFDIGEVVLSDPELCCAQCAQTPGCVLYSLFVNKNTGVQRCLLKSQASNDKTNYGDSASVTAYSGFVTNPLPLV